MAIIDHWYALKDMVTERRLMPAGTTISTTWEPSAELNAVMALSGDRTNAGTLPEAARFESAEEDRMSDDLKQRHGQRADKEQLQQRAADFWQRALDVGRQQQQSGKQMHEAEREVSKEPRLRM